jgi:16S rRNA (uracil1498-N3)-methyltransferase
MPHAKAKIRLYVPSSYAAGGKLALNQNQSHYTQHVMRCKTGDTVMVFNGRDGVWLAQISALDKKHVVLELLHQIEKQRSSPDLWLAFAPLKNKTDLVVEKATELGVTKIMVVYTRHAVVTSINHEKLHAHAIEAAEQCERHDIAVIEEQKDIATLLACWPSDRLLLYGDESGGGEALKEQFFADSVNKYGVLIGPEGGFSEEEHRMLKHASFAKAFSMGPRILRADTAAVAALACVQSAIGDWQHKPRFEVA